MKTYAYSLIAIIVAFVLASNSTALFPSDEINLFLSVISLIYGLIAAFTISAAWERFSKIRDGIATETNSLIVMYLYSKQLTDKEAFKNLKNHLTEYCEDVLKTSWHEYWAKESLHKKFREMIEIVTQIKIRNKKDEEIFTHGVGEEIRKAADARTHQLVLSQTRIPTIQWILNIFLSAIIIIGLIFRHSSNNILSIFITAGMIAATLMLLVVMYEFDSMKVAEEEVSNEPYRNVVRVIKSDGGAQISEK